LKRLFARHGVVVLLFFGLMLLPACAIESGNDKEIDAGTDDAGTDAGQQTDQDSAGDPSGADEPETPDEEACKDECPTEGQRDCLENGHRECGFFDEDDCLEWSQVTPCPTGEVCSNGACALECSDECETSGEQRCLFSTAGYEVCADHDADGCLEWGGLVPCDAGSICEAGECVCSAICEPGETRCVPNVEAFQECADHDGDGCADWGTQTDCEEGHTCHPVLKACVRPYPEGPYGKWWGDTMANECLKRVECDGETPVGTVDFCFDEFLLKKATVISIHTGW
jgi:hypothetical protein